MKTTICGKTYEFQPRPDETAVDVIRHRAGLTGTKLVCGSGSCGACAVMIDGVAVNSCLLPAHALDGRSIQTIEMYGLNELHPIQRAIMAKDGLQCGMCTAGFVIEGITFYRSWRKEHGRDIPSRAEVMEAMAGHLCRCGAYAEIIAAIQCACAGDFDDSDELVSPRLEAIHKVTGQAKFTVDIHYDGQLEGRIVRSPHPNAKVISISTSGLMAMEGVRAVVHLLEDEQQFVHYVGQPIVAVAAVSRQAAEEALENIDIEYELRPFVTDTATARNDTAPPAYPEHKKRLPNISQGPIIPGRWEGNVRSPISNRIMEFRGRKVHPIISKAQKSTELETVSGTWRTAAQIHGAFEPHGCVAHWEKDGHLTVHVSTQNCYGSAKAIADFFSLPRESVQVLCQYVGGGFGGKQGLGPETIAAIGLSREARAPVRVTNDWSEEMAYGGYRPPSEIELTLVANQQGGMQALYAAAYSNGGIGVNSMVAALMNLVYSGGPKKLLDFDVLTNLPPGKPFRAPFGPPACWAIEQAVDQIGHNIGLDPLSLRRRWDNHSLRKQLYDWVETIPAWQKRSPVGQNSGRHRCGIGVAIGSWLNYYWSGAQIELIASESGFTAKTAAQDMGNGTCSVIAHAVALELGVSPGDIDVLVGDSDDVPGPSSTSSATTSSVLHPASAAARKMRDKLLAAAREELNLLDAQLGKGGIISANGHTPWQELLPQIRPIRVVIKRGSNESIDLNRLLPIDISIGRGTAGIIYVSEVEVDMSSGQVRVVRVWGGIAAGKIILPHLARSQIHGGIIQGIGYALFEERIIDPATGYSLSRGLSDYHIPGIGDMPEIELFFHEEGFEHVKGGAIGLSELSTIPVAASIGNAVFHATGQRYYELPLHPARILQGGCE
jgi:xanthine dehydrogenase YagR molybdenum-binding subunit